MSFKKLLWNRQNCKAVRWILGSLCCIALAFCVVALANSASADGKTAPTTLSVRQLQNSCTPANNAICDIDQFTALDGGRTIHYVAPDPLSERIQGSWSSHCAQFSGIPTYISVQSLNLDTMKMVNVSQNVAQGDFQSCEAYFTLSGS